MQIIDAAARRRNAMATANAKAKYQAKLNALGKGYQITKWVTGKQVTVTCPIHGVVLNNQEIISLFRRKSGVCPQCAET